MKSSISPAPPSTHDRYEVTLGRSGGRKIALEIPSDFNPIEMLDLIGWLTTDLAMNLQAQSSKNKIMVAKSMPPQGNPSPSR